ncbi:hypothetical protein TREMEDRAFT_63945 [Tremella mesenterica DSM 1558]|uniref:uncharacterized protein n=1 Tax=Tremella mesenterica (strain ATCC 24925 / CBS 8224 / DSM 1558 / NBRC 9311 / NRRL Y-6157 / RJB 2259-6 / UBC 559-6) TaxID=578456 RepID=UPI0003F492A7|nr:uncharacterized protein TREMEDRAFT_63945 [Tremella mesenterica DSM 1558]EIW68057.1 hypothetical protein TREMEDRAFT_63945 [Tremella mesenterica DSM 1558]
MVPRLETRISSSSTPYPPPQTIKTNSSPTPLRTSSFEGTVALWLKSPHEKEAGQEYFSHPSREGMTYAIVVRGRFVDDVSADDIFFGNVFENPVRDHLPWGSSIAMRAMQWLDPSIEMDAYADRPWALSPLLATMNYVSITRQPQNGVIVEEDCDLLEELAGIQKWKGDSKARSSSRKAWFNIPANREKVQLKGLEISLEFCNGYLDFNTFSVTLPRPFNLSIPLLKYWDGQPVTYVCQMGKQPGERACWSVAYHIVDAVPLDDTASAKPNTEEEERSSGSSSEREWRGRVIG